jgi:hypothetical protein
MSNGPLKIILIHAGKYDYAEVELDGAIQIVGPNNTGKTTLINTLQFLYIDDLRRMDFGQYTPEQTRNYYFPNQYSYILFECQYGAGKCVFGWRGQSKTSGNDPERFFFTGEFQGDDFFETKGQIREPRDTNARLALRQYQTIKGAQQHRELLLTGKTSGAAGMGIVSLRETDKYHHFRDTLKNLLSLSTITQDQMRDRLLMLAEIPSEAVALDARLLFGEDYDIIRRRRDALLRFKKHSDKVGLLVKRFGERETVRGELVFRWTDLRTKRQAFEGEHQQKVSKLRSDIDTEVVKQAALRLELQTSRKSENGLREERGALNSALQKLDAQTKNFAEFVEELERQGLRTIEEEIATLQRHLSDAETENVALVERRIAGAKAMVQQKDASLRNFDRLLVTKLRQAFSDEELDTLFTLLNFELLEYPAGPDGVDVRDGRALESWFREALSRVRDGVFEDRIGRIRLRPGHRRLSELENIERVREELDEWRRTLERLTATLTAIRERERLQEQLRTKRAERETKARRLYAFEQFQKDKMDEPRLRSELKRFDESLNALTDRIRKAEQQAEDSQSRQSSLKGVITKAENEFNAVMGRFNICRFPEFDSKVIPVTDIPNDFDAGIAVFLRRQETEHTIANEVAVLLREVELVLGEEFLGMDEKETVMRLQQEFDALPEKENALAKDWNAHLHGLKSTFDQVLKELSEVKSAADQINRQFKAVQVSNLKSVRLDPVEHSDHVVWIRRLAEMQQPSLFDEDPGLEATLRNFRQKLENNPIIRYSDLFILRFTVVGDDDVAHHYQDFKQIESHGTTITVKVLFNLLVLKSLLRKDDCLVPFFLDEIQALDEANRRAILTMAKRLGFIAITASPDAVGEVDSLYYLQPRKGRVTLKANHRYRVGHRVETQ